MQLTSITPAQKTALEIQSRVTLLISQIDQGLAACYARLNTPGLQAETVAEIGTSAVAAATLYNSLHGCLVAAGAVPSCPPLDPAIWVAQADGTVRYVEPIQPTLPPITSPPAAAAGTVSDVAPAPVTTPTELSGS